MQRGARLKISIFLTIIQAILVRYVKVDQEWVEKARAAAAKGSLVFVLRNRSLIDFLCLRGLCHKHGLPEVSFVSGLSPLTYMPLICWLARFFRAKRSNPLQDAMASSGSAVVFLRKPAAGGALDSQPVSEDGIRMAIDAQQTFPRPIVALPAVFLWGEHPMERLPGTIDFIFGSNEYPRLSRSIWLLIRRRSVHEMMLGDPINIQQFGDERRLALDALAGVIRAGVGRQIETMRRLRLGSFTKPSSRIKKEVLSSPRLQRELRAIAIDEGIPKSEIRPKAREIIEKLAADFNPRVVTIFALVLEVVWRKLYTGIDIRKADLDRMREVITRGASLLLPSHRSHIDYLVLSQVMRTHNFIIPHIVAGQNLMFWPMGWIFRSSGAFFIRRHFEKARFYIAVVGAYVRRLIQERNTIEVFIEGGRSRSGKLIRPKSGLLEMALRGIGATPREELFVIPVYIGYEHVIEEKAYVKETRGLRKKAESLTGLLKSMKVLFRKFGRLYVRVGDCFSIQDMLDKEGFSRDDLLKPDICRKFSSQIAMKTYREINSKTIVTPVALLSLVVLSDPRSTLSHGELRQRVLQLIDVLKSLDVELSPIVAKWSDERPKKRLDALDREIRSFYRAGRVQRIKKNQSFVYSAETHHRLTLDYYKNNIIHFLAPVSLICSSCLSSDNQEKQIEDICRDFAIAANLYNWEFIMDIHGVADGVEFDENVRNRVSKAVALLVHHKILVQSGSTVSIIDHEYAFFLANILLNFHESYFSVIETLRNLDATNENSPPTPREIETVTARASKTAKEHLTSGRFRRVEGHMPLSLRYATRSFQDLEILPKKAGEEIVPNPELEEDIYQFLKGALNVTGPKDQISN